MADIKVILLAHVKNKGKAGDVVRMKKGYFRYLECEQKAIYATPTALAELEKKRELLQQQDELARQEAEKWALKLDQKTFTLFSEAGDTGILYGSISARDIAKELATEGIGIHPNQILLPEPLKQTGQHAIRVDLHPLVHVEVIINIQHGHPAAPAA